MKIPKILKKKNKIMLNLDYFEKKMKLNSKNHWKIK